MLYHLFFSVQQVYHKIRDCTKIFQFIGIRTFKKKEPRLKACLPADRDLWIAAICFDWEIA